MSALVSKSKQRASRVPAHAKKLGIYPKRRPRRRHAPIQFVVGPFPRDDIENTPFRFYPADYRDSILAAPVNLVTSARKDDTFHYCGINR